LWEERSGCCGRKRKEEERERGGRKVAIKK
jgi:hypothetical protein